MTREQAEQALGSDASLVGDFLVRESPADGCHCITVKVTGGQFEHHKVKRVAAGQPYQLNGKAMGVICLSVLDVVRHLSKNREQTTVLLNFVAPNEGESENIYGAMQREVPAAPLDAWARGLIGCMFYRRSFRVTLRTSSRYSGSGPVCFAAQSSKAATALIFC